MIRLIKPFLLSALAGFLLFPFKTSSSEESILFSQTIPENLGINIHFATPRPGEMQMLSELGVGWVRADFAWELTEKEKEKYDFSGYEGLLKALDEQGLKALVILAYGNPLYDQGLAPYTKEGREAFARWAAAAVKHFQGRGYLWEIWNEPNVHHFWRPRPKVEDYIQLALKTGQAIQASSPQEILIGPATSGIPLEFLKKCFQSGLLNYWSAVSVHPYREGRISPEMATARLWQLRRLIERYAPPRKRIPVLSGEWGYSSEGPPQALGRQGKFLARQWLNHLANDIPLSIWYDWHDDGPNPTDSEHHFGTVQYPFFEGRTPVYDPKPAFHAAKTLTQVLKGFYFDREMRLGKPRNHILFFRKGEEFRLAVWTTSLQRSTVSLPLKSGRYRVIQHTGEESPPMRATRKGLRLTLHDAPLYLIPDY